MNVRSSIFDRYPFREELTASQQDPLAVAQWREERLPELNRIDFYDSNNNGGIKIFILFSPLNTGINAMD
ncbi:hypothetical protein [Spirosoma endophyticum]|uniref:Uncharacterized protein n=1 Tax=Spirosoma endophyticum TaxID=662367 RepID=A0A1I2FR03_9BACT|nr:hypothetical protein [Spirosoma endophyticum]SFF07208.1 hypothetical protein SAMN05216167_12717 [Spirosoma endophyticum]